MSAAASWEAPTVQKLAELAREMTSTPRAGGANIIVLRPTSLRRLVELLDDTDEDNDQINVTQYAFRTAFNLIEEAEHLAGGNLFSSPVPDSEGGIRVTWRNGDRQVKLICPATRQGPAYIYYSSAEGNDLINQHVNAVVLADRLDWLIDRDPRRVR